MDVSITQKRTRRPPELARQKCQKKEKERKKGQPTSLLSRKPAMGPRTVKALKILWRAKPYLKRRGSTPSFLGVKEGGKKKREEGGEKKMRGGVFSRAEKKGNLSQPVISFKQQQRKKKGLRK